MKEFGYVCFGVLIGAGIVAMVTDHYKPAVKRSMSGLCHSEDSQYYDAIKYYSPYDSMTQCVLEGGAIPTRMK